MGAIQDIKIMGHQPHEDKYNEIVDGLKSGIFKNVIFITGAGISTAAGIPDFRSKGGLFELAKKIYNLSRPESILQINYFYKFPEHFYDLLSKKFDISECRPTTTHLFMGFLCNVKNIVLRIFTQNFDGLELSAGVPRKIITFAHGTIKEVGCPGCLQDLEKSEIEKVKDAIKKGINKREEVPKCTKCGKPLKPKIVFYGEKLEKSFFETFKDVHEADLAFIMGTSLAVYPFNQLPYGIKEDAWRVLVNKREVGNFLGGLITMNQFRFNNPKKKDLFLNGYTDDVVKKLVEDCGWKEEFDQYCKEKLDKFEENLKNERIKSNQMRKKK